MSDPAVPVQASNGFIGFFWTYLPLRKELECCIFQLYSQLLKKLGFYDKHVQEIVLSGTGPVRVILKEAHMTLEQSAAPKHVCEPSTDFVLFRGDYIRVFLEGGVLFNILKAMLESHAQKIELAELMKKFDSYESASRKSTKGNAFLRAFCWFVDRHFVSKFPAEFRVAFRMDCLLYSDWRISHPNLVGLHMLMLAWMLDVEEFSKFRPEGLRACSVIVAPPYARFLEIMGIQISIANLAQVKTEKTETEPQTPAPSNTLIRT